MAGSISNAAHVCNVTWLVIGFQGSFYISIITGRKDKRLLYKYWVIQSANDLTLKKNYATPCINYDQLGSLKPTKRSHPVVSLQCFILKQFNVTWPRMWLGYSAIFHFVPCHCEQMDWQTDVRTPDMTHVISSVQCWAKTIT